MVYETDTYRILHDLKDEYREEWYAFLEQKADELLYRKHHFFRYLYYKTLEKLNLKDPEEISGVFSS